MKLETRNNNFDLLRLIAAFMVAYSHFLRLLDIGEDPLLKITGNIDTSELGVIVFFIISGYLVTKSFTYAKSRTQFLFNRVLRIFPGYLVCLLFCVFIVGALSTTWNIYDYLTSYKTYLFFLNSYLFTLQYQLPGVFEANPRQYTVNSAIWTLCIEFLAYLMLFVMFNNKKILKTYCVIGLTLLVVFLNIIYHEERVLFAHQVDDPLGAYFLYYFNFTESLRFVLYFFIGSMFSLFKSTVTTNKYIFLLCVISWVLSWQTQYYDVIELLTVPYCVLFLGLTYNKNIDLFFKKVGDLSYGVYLYHSPVAQFVWYKGHLTFDTFEMVLMSIFLTLLLSAISWHLVERMALGYKSYSYSKIKNRPSQSSFESNRVNK
ncbi:MAG: acyltransferase [Pseudomonadales bacterium]|uniref:acyltransferase family protein n=1 Tax=Moritella sp. TaxID=78556 RepID=UPI001D766122|nr:acyltransferase [Moritella sp.]MCJ8314564.1 acyltransferase [Pseudomonadales bacterium]NQZ50762.1 acyltransferase [Moritella sp.]